MNRIAISLLALIATGASAQNLTQTYRPAATRILNAAAADTDGYAALAYLCDHIGKRNSGSPELQTAVQWGADLMRKAGLRNVVIQPAMIPHWVRGSESAAIITPIAKPLHMLGLGMSVATPKEGITAEVIFLPDFAALDATPAERIRGKIVVINPGWHGYGVNSQYRVFGASRVAAKGAVAYLVRSATGLVEQTPHTGTLVYDDKQPKIPAAALSPEDALLIERLTKEAPVKIHLQMEAHTEADVKSGNVIGEIPGSEHPEQVVVLGGHIDSWDVGQGAQDDGSGMIGAFEAVSLIHKLGLKPKRTIRVVFWVNEENGGAGGRAYRDALTPEQLANHVAAIEMDGGAELPLGFSYGSGTGGPRRSAGANTPGSAPPAGSLAASAPQANPANAFSTGAFSAIAANQNARADFDESKLPEDQRNSFAILHQIAALLEPIKANTVTPGGGGSDIGPITSLGVPSLSPRTTGEHYFDWHHTEADTLDKVDPEDFRKNIALLSVLSYVLADMPGRLAGQKGAGE